MESLDHGRLEATIWVHEEWQIAELTSAEKLWINQDKLKLILDTSDRNSLALSPQAVFKNARYFKEHRSPFHHTLLHLTKQGYMSIHSHLTIDIPCIKIPHTKSVSLLLFLVNSIP